MAHDVNVLIFLQEVLMTVDAAMVIKILHRLPGVINVGLAKHHSRLPFVTSVEELRWRINYSPN